MKQGKKTITFPHSNTEEIINFLLPILFSQNFGEREQGVVVIYVTTLSILRDTWARCVKVRQILRNLLIKVDEKDVFMSRENQVELMDRMAMVEVNLPQVFVNGQYLGVRYLPEVPRSIRHFTEKKIIH